MARDIKKPEVILESDLKEYAGPVEIDVTPREKVEEPAKEEVVEAPKIEIPAGAAVPKPATATNIISYGAWFQKRSACNPKLKLSYKGAIEAHCKAMGVKLSATEEEFDSVLSHFGL